MKLLLHTIALEPARWTPQRTSRSILDLLPLIAHAGFDRLEVYEPHLANPELSAAEIRQSLVQHGLQPVILSSYLNLNPAETTDAEVSASLDVMAERIEFFGFTKLRLFAGSRMSPADTDGITVFAARLRSLARRLTNTEVLLETHDTSLADDPRLIVRIVEELALPNVALLFQPAIFRAESAMKQLGIQKHLIRHLHLQNRNPDGSFATLHEGMVPWKHIFSALPPDVEASIEFVPSGICPVEQFNLQQTLAQARSEADWVNQS